MSGWWDPGIGDWWPSPSGSLEQWFPTGRGARGWLQGPGPALGGGLEHHRRCGGFLRCRNTSWDAVCGSCGATAPLLLQSSVLGPEQQRCCGTVPFHSQGLSLSPPLVSPSWVLIPKPGPSSTSRWAWWGDSEMLQVTRVSETAGSGGAVIQERELACLWPQGNAEQLV